MASSLAGCLLLLDYDMPLVCHVIPTLDVGDIDAPTVGASSAQLQDLPGMGNGTVPVTFELSLHGSHSGGRFLHL